MIKKQPHRRTRRLAAALAILGIPIFARTDDEARMSLVTESARLEVLETTHGATLKEKARDAGVEDAQGAGILTVTHPAFPDEWSRFGLTFKSPADCTAKLAIGGNFGAERNYEILIDDVQAQGITIRNADFEKSGKRPGAIPGWQATAKGEATPAHATGAGVAAQGDGCVRLSKTGSVMQTISVPKDIEITITVAVRLAIE